MDKGIVTQAFPLHDPVARPQLRLTWVRAVTKRQPLNAVRRYFGEKIALYFAFIGFYTIWLLAPAAAGIIAFGVQHAADPRGNSIALPAFAFFVLVWATVFRVLEAAAVESRLQVAHARLRGA